MLSFVVLATQHACSLQQFASDPSDLRHYDLVLYGHLFVAHYFLYNESKQMDTNFARRHDKKIRQKVAFEQKGEIL